VSTAELAAWLGDSGRPQPLLLDARAPEEYRVSHLPGARLAPDRKTALALLEGLPADTPIVVYCSVGYRSARLADKLRRAGYSRACNLEGSIFQWANEDRPLAGPDGPTRLVHPFNPDWGTLLERDRWAPLGER
jgi:rhodanese-related sulfurtransferase